MLRWIFRKLIVKQPKLFNCKKVIFVGPHPDDIEIGAGATVARLIDKGIEVVYIICTDDRYSSIEEDFEPLELAKKRKKEAIRAAEYMGVKDLRFLGFSDGGLWNLEDMTKSIALQYAEIDADMIFLPDPNMRDEYHLDHIKVGRAASAALWTGERPKTVKDIGGRGYSRHKGACLYYTDKPNFYVKCSRKNVDKQLNAIYLHESQMFNDEKENITRYIKFRGLRMGLRRLTRHAEAFRMLDKVYLHCVTEECE